MTATDDEEKRAESAHRQRLADEVRKIQREMVASNYDQARAYTNVILLTGYAGAFAIWNFTRAEMTPVGQASVALLLLVSLSSFIIFEVFKMTMIAIILRRHNKVLFAQTTAEGFLREYEEFRTDVQESGFRLLQPVWMFSLFISVGTALFAAMLMVLGFVSVLTGWP